MLHKMPTDHRPRAPAPRCGGPVHGPVRAPWLIVLDTNVWLDLLVFDDARARPLQAAVAGGHLLPLVTDAMLGELADVLARPFPARWAFEPAAVLARAAALSRRVCPAAPAAGMVPRCRDPEDQCFIDLAWLWPVRWLVSRDRALLELARPARARALAVVTPQDWAGSWPNEAATDASDAPRRA